MIVEEKLDALLRRAAKDVDDGLVPSCQLAVGLDGEIVVNEAFGQATVDTRYVMFSCTKAVTASAVWMLIGDGVLDIERPVTSSIPEFMELGEPERRHAVTVEQVLLHTSGFPYAPMRRDVWGTRDSRLERFRTWRLNLEPGTRYEYHATSAHWVLGELIERLGGTDYRAFILDRVVKPLGLDALRVGVPPAEQDDIADLVLTGAPIDPDELESLIGLREFPVGEVTDDALMAFNDPAARAVGVPGGGGVSTAADLARFYQALLHNPGGLWDADVLADATSRIRTTLADPLRGTPANRSLGMIIASDDGKAAMRGMGHTVSARAFGHDGAAGQIAFADPETGLSFAYLTNGRDVNIIREWRRTSSLASKAAVLTTPT